MKTKKKKARKGAMMGGFCTMPDVVRLACKLNENLPENLMDVWTKNFLDNVNYQLWRHGLHLSLGRGEHQGKYIGLRRSDAPGTLKQQAHRIKRTADRDFAKFLKHLEAQEAELASETDAAAAHA
jgi:hypothetical protein